MQHENIKGKISIFKNNTDTPGNTYGCHENYLMDRRVSFRQLAGKLIPFFVTRQVFTGAGKIKPSNRGQYAISQRAEHIREEISIATTTARGIINTRDEPHADREKYRRLHVIVGDSNMSEYANLLKVGTTDIVLRMIEANFITRQFALRNSVHAIQRISDDVTCTRTVELENGRRLSAVEMQLEYLDLAKQYLEEEGSDPTTDLVMKCWEHVLTCLQENPEQLDRELDWVIKRRLIETYASSRNIDWDSPKIAMLDYQYHNIRTDVGLYYKLEKDN